VNFDAATISAFAAAAAAIAAATVAGIQFYIGYRQSKADLISAQAAMMNAESAGRHTIASFRQEWIETVRDTLSEYHSILMSTGGALLSQEDERKLAALRTKLGLMLNPDENDSLDLLRLIVEMRHCSPTDRHHKDLEISKLAHRILKTEWIRIKDELKERGPSRS
jgi:hypothetical protein